LNKIFSIIRINSVTNFKKKDKEMNTYKKIIVVAAGALILPTMSNALDMQGKAIAKRMKSIMMTNPDFNISEWKKLIAETVYPYILQNAAGDKRLENILAQLIDVNNNAMESIVTLRTLRNNKTKTKWQKIELSGFLPIKKYLTELAAESDAIYFTSTKQNARIILSAAINWILFALDTIKAEIIHLSDINT
jgi:hypothetical protein